MLEACWTCHKSWEQGRGFRSSYKSQTPFNGQFNTESSSSRSVGLKCLHEKLILSPLSTSQQNRRRRRKRTVKILRAVKTPFCLCAPPRCLSPNPLSPLRIVLKMKNLCLALVAALSGAKTERSWDKVTNLLWNFFNYHPSEREDFNEIKCEKVIYLWGSGSR